MKSWTRTNLDVTECKKPISNTNKKSDRRLVFQKKLLGQVNFADFTKKPSFNFEFGKDYLFIIFYLLYHTRFFKEYHTFYSERPKKYIFLSVFLLSFLYEGASFALLGVPSSKVQIHPSLTDPLSAVTSTRTLTDSVYQQKLRRFITWNQGVLLVWN